MDGIELEPLGGEKTGNEKENKQTNGVTFGKWQNNIYFIIISPE